MADVEKLKELGFSQYEITCYLTLVSNHPLNGSRLSKLSGIARSRIYDVLRKMSRRGLVMEVDSGQYVPLPPEELIKRLKNRFDSNIDTLKRQLDDSAQETKLEYLWSLRGYANVIAKAKQMILSARKEIYVRLFPQAGELLNADLRKAQTKGVGIRYIAMGEVPLTFEIQVVHPNCTSLAARIGGRSFDIITDRSEALVGIFEAGREDASPITWSKNRWFVIANRDSLRHDFYHYFLEKVYDREEDLDPREKKIYAFIKNDD
jgi:sugar-specific transcriptional regulator TrmB